MKITQQFIDQIERYGFGPSDFFMVEMGWFHGYCKKLDNQSQHTGPLQKRHMIPIERFERLTELPEYSHAAKKPIPVERHDFVINKLVNIYTPQKTRVQPKQARNMEVFLSSAPPGASVFEYWQEEEKRSQRDVIYGRLALAEICGQLSGWAFETLTPGTFGMCFRDDVDALLFAGVLPAIREEFGNVRNLGDKKIWKRKHPW